jgi:hypothetical protein
LAAGLATADGGAHHLRVAGGEGDISREFGRDALGQALGAQDDVDSMRKAAKAKAKPSTKPVGTDPPIGSHEWDAEAKRATGRLRDHFDPMVPSRWRMRSWVELLLVFLALSGFAIAALIWDSIYGDDEQQVSTSSQPSGTRSSTGSGVSGSGNAGGTATGVDVSGVYTIHLKNQRAIGPTECFQSEGTLTIEQRGTTLRFISGSDRGNGRINRDLTFTGKITAPNATETMDGSFTVKGGGRITVHASDVLEDVDGHGCESILDGERR